MKNININILCVSLLILFIQRSYTAAAAAKANRTIKETGNKDIVYGKRVKIRQVGGIHDKHLTTAVPTGLLGVKDAESLLLHENDLHDLVNYYSRINYTRPTMSRIMLRMYREGDGLLSCRKCGHYSIGPHGECCQGCSKLGYNGCWCRMCDCLCYLH